MINNKSTGRYHLISSPISHPSPPDSLSQSPPSPCSYNQSYTHASPGTCGSHKTSSHTCT
ncbi:hypothetical protein Hanom_Chr07g00667391 [Helianthus anomalus]